MNVIVRLLNLACGQPLPAEDNGRARRLQLVMAALLLVAPLRARLGRRRRDPRPDADDGERVEGAARHLPLERVRDPRGPPRLEALAGQVPRHGLAPRVLRAASSPGRWCSPSSAPSSRSITSRASGRGPFSRKIAISPRARRGHDRVLARASSAGSRGTAARSSSHRRVQGDPDRDAPPAHRARLAYPPRAHPHRPRDRRLAHQMEGR